MIEILAADPPVLLAMTMFNGWDHSSKAVVAFGSTTEGQGGRAVTSGVTPIW